jgi:hypothetical protein
MPMSPPEEVFGKLILHDCSLLLVLENSLLVDSLPPSRKYVTRAHLQSALDIAILPSPSRCDYSHGVSSTGDDMVGNHEVVMVEKYIIY